MKHTLAILAIAGTALLAMAYAACRPLPAAAAVSPEDIQAARACGLSSEDSRRLGEDVSILLSLVQADVLQKEDIQRAATALLERPDTPWPVETYEVVPDEGAVRLGGVSLPLPNDHDLQPRGLTTYSVWCQVAWQPDGPFAIPAAGHPTGPFDTSWLLALLPNRGACYQLVSAPAAWRLSSILELPKVSLPETEAGPAAPPLGFYAYMALDAPGLGLDAGLVLNPETGRWDVFTWWRTVDETVWRQGSLEPTPESGSKFLLILEVTREGNGCNLRIYDTSNWTLAGWFYEPLPPECHITRANLAMEFRLVSAVATSRGDVPPGVRYSCIWQAPSLAGLTEVPPGKDGTRTLWGMKLAPGWTLLSRDYVQGTGSYPAPPDPTVWVYLPAVSYREVIVEIRGE